MVRGIEGRDIFVDDADREWFLDRLSVLLSRSSTKCFAWAFLDNHLHLLLMPTVVSLSETMRRLLTGYAVYFNRKHHRRGHLFQNRYKSVLCQEEPYLLELVRYIHLNPLRAGIVADLEALEHYPWSGHAILLGHGSMECQETGEVLARFGRNRSRALRGYRQFIADGVAAGHRDELAGGGLRRSMIGTGDGEEVSSFDERILGSGDFVEMLTQGDRANERTKHSTMALGELLQCVSSATGVVMEKLQGPGKERDVARARAIFCCLAVYECGYTAKEAGKSLGLGSAGASLAVKRGREALRNDQSLRDRVLGN
jgi:REP element-mobilizing transposase RayT